MSSYNVDDDDDNWLSGCDPQLETQREPQKPENHTDSKTLVMVETAFFATTAALIWLINFYFPLGPILKILFSIPLAFLCLRRGIRACVMGTIVCGLLLSILMGPSRSILFIIPYGLMGIQLGILWRRGASWFFSIFLGTVIGTFGFFFRFWLFSVLLGEDVWAYVISQVTELADWLFIKLGLLTQPSLWMIQLIALVVVVINNLIYLFAVHLMALLLLDRQGYPIPRPPRWIQVILDYE